MAHLLVTEKANRTGRVGSCVREKFRVCYECVAVNRAVYQEPAKHLAEPPGARLGRRVVRGHDHAVNFGEGRPWKLLNRPLEESDARGGIDGLAGPAGIESFRNTRSRLKQWMCDGAFQFQDRRVANQNIPDAHAGRMKDRVKPDTPDTDEGETEVRESFGWID